MTEWTAPDADPDVLEALLSVRWDFGPLRFRDEQRLQDRRRLRSERELALDPRPRCRCGAVASTSPPVKGKVGASCEVCGRRWNVRG